MGYDETIKYLYGLQKHGIKLGLENPRCMLALFGNPQARFRSVHVAGTNGKGSTCAALASMLRAAGLKTGLFTSPHLVSFTERIMVDEREINEAGVVSLAEEIRRVSARLEATFFEVATTMGFLHFMREGVDWAVVETGMGGRLDATNVLTPDVSVITTIDIDHMEFLGEGIEEIAREKAGIIKPGVPVVSAAQPHQAMEAIAGAAREHGSPLHLAGEGFTFRVKDLKPGRVTFDYRSGDAAIDDLTLPLSGRHQALNASLAIRAFELIHGGPRTEEAVRKGLASLRWPGRLERVPSDPPLLMDVAHNPGAARALARTLRETYLQGGERLVLVMGVMADKEISEILRPLLPLASQTIFAAPAYDRAARPEELEGIAQSLGFNSRIAPSVKEALDMARELKETVLVTGSFYTVGEAREALGMRGFLPGLREWRAHL